jgi:uncharacterized protein YacL
MPSPASVNIARLLYLLVCEFAGLAIALSTRGTDTEVPLWGGLLGGVIVAGFFILVERLAKDFTLRGFSNAIFGLLVGIFCAWLLTRVDVSQLITLACREKFGSSSGAESLADSLRLSFDVTLFASLGFLGAVLALRSSRDDFSFIIPYVRFRQDGISGRAIILDTESIMDGRVPAMMRSGFLGGRMVVPRCVLDELQLLAQSPVPATRSRGQRGLDCLDQMKSAPDLQITIDDSAPAAPGDTLDVRLVQTARMLGARLMSTDEGLSKVARLQGVDVLNIHELLDALKPTVTVGNRLHLALVRGGRDDHQAVGYLADGTMIVVNHAVALIGTTVDVLVISTLQTSGGMMIFAELHNHH